MSKQLILDAFDLKPVDRVPVGLWWHYTTPDEWKYEQGSPEIFKRAFEGHLGYAKEAKLDLLKVMPDIYMLPPNLEEVDVRSAEELAAVKPIGADDPYYAEHIALIKKLTDELGDDTAVFPTIFSPYYYLLNTWLHTERRQVTEADLLYAIENHPEALKHAADVVADDIIAQSVKFVTEAGAAGIFYAVHRFPGISDEQFGAVFAPAERRIAYEIAKVNSYTLLHVCGSIGVPNNFSYYDGLPFKALNYSVENEKLSIAQLKERFPDKVIIGGFSNAPGSVIHEGTKEQIQAETRKIIEEAGRDRLIVGADCALIPEKSSNEKVIWVKEIADTL